MPPEILNYILFQNNMEYDKAMLEKMSEYKNPWTIDMWSLGCIVLEIVSGVPLWMSAKTRTPENEMVTGLFAVKNRVFNRIVQKQIEVVQQLDFHLRENVSKMLFRITLELCLDKSLQLL
jgi:dual specificity tyrosine-phosphorylation-regulated kinase 2/3/4